jgi:hypothetical protein
MSNFSSIARGAMVTAMLIGLTGCGGGGGSDSPPPSSSPPPPAPAPPPPPPAPAPATPPISSTVVDISAGQAIGVSRWGDPRTDGTPRAGFNCVVNPPDAVQFRAHLSIMVNNELQRIPSRIGQAITGDTHCFYPIHVDGNDASGRIHVESATEGRFTLGQFFEIWGQPLTNTNIAGISGLPIEIHVTENGTVMKVEEADWGNIEFKSHREITIELGTPTAEIPNFTWTD